MQNQKMNKKIKKIFSITLAVGLLLFIGSYVFDYNEVFGYGYSYGYGYDAEGNYYFADTDVSFSKEDKKEISSSNKTHLKELKLEFDKIENATHFMISTDEDFEGEEWRPIQEDKTIKLKDKKYVKQRFYIKFKAIDGAESGVFKKTLIYKPQSRKIKNSPSKARNGEVVRQYGERFSKDNDVALYFSDPNGDYYPTPMIVRTDGDGKFSVDYVVNKPAGKYKWYAVDLRTGNKSEKIYYRVK